MVTWPYDWYKYHIFGLLRYFLLGYAPHHCIIQITLQRNAEDHGFMWTVLVSLCSAADVLDCQRKFPSSHWYACCEERWRVELIGKSMSRLWYVESWQTVSLNEQHSAKGPNLKNIQISYSYHRHQGSSSQLLLLPPKHKKKDVCQKYTHTWKVHRALWNN